VETLKVDPAEVGGRNSGMDGLKKWLRRLRGVFGLGATWAVGWAGFLSIATVLVDLIVGYPWTPTIANLLANAGLFAALGFLGGSAFSVVLGIAGRRRTFDKMSVPGFLGWGTAGGVILGLLMSFTSGPITVPGILSTTIVTAILGAGSAAGSLVLARGAEEQELLEPGAPGHIIEAEEEVEKLLRGED
jgi:hypothetical protein